MEKFTWKDGEKTIAPRAKTDQDMVSIGRTPSAVTLSISDVRSSSIL